MCGSARGRQGSTRARASPATRTKPPKGTGEGYDRLGKGTGKGEGEGDRRDGGGRARVRVRVEAAQFYFCCFACSWASRPKARKHQVGFMTVGFSNGYKMGRARVRARARVNDGWGVVEEG